MGGGGGEGGEGGQGCGIILLCCMLSSCGAIQILGSDQTVMVVLAANSEEDLTNWMQTLCEAVIEQEVREEREGEGREGREER